MNYDALTPEYRAAQAQRIQRSIQRINERLRSVQLGRVVPDNDDVVLGTGRRLKMAVLFLDICGFSGRPLETVEEQEATLRYFALFFTEMIRIAEDYGGTIEKNTGDGLMAYFEDDCATSRDSGTKRAVACALTMMEATERLINPAIRNGGGDAITFRIGVDHGYVTVARLGAARRFGSLVAIGATANVACKMLAHAQPGEILLGQCAYTQLPYRWKVDWCKLAKLDTGWVFRGTGRPYGFYRYTGRWAAIKPLSAVI